MIAALCDSEYDEVGPTDMAIVARTQPRVRRTLGEHELRRRVEFGLRRERADDSHVAM